MSQMLTKIKQRFCDHAVSHDDIRRVSPEEVECPCRKCAFVLKAPYGVALKARWVPPREGWLQRAIERLQAEKTA